MYPGMMYGGGMGWWGVFAFFACMALIALFVLLIARIDRPWRDLPDPAKRILDARFARGELDQKEYLERRALIR